jgi:heme exporter protein B
MLRSLTVLLSKDLRLEFRRKELFSGLFMTAILISFLFVFVINSLVMTSATRQGLATGAVFIAGILAGLIAVERSLKSDFSNRALERLQLLQVPLTSFYLAKTIYNFLAIFLAMLLSYLVMLAAFGMPLSSFAGMTILALPVSLAVSALLSLLAGMTYNSRLGAMLLVIIGLPLLLPLLAFAIDVALLLAAQGTIDLGSMSYNFVLGLLTFYLLLGINLADHVYRS